MSVFCEYECKVLKILTSPRLNPDQLSTIIETATLVSYEHTVVGYFLTVAHPLLPSERVVCDNPMVTGLIDDGTDCGFIVFLKNGELTIECYSYGDDTVPDDIRKRKIEIDIAT